MSDMLLCLLSWTFVRDDLKLALHSHPASRQPQSMLIPSHLPCVACRTQAGIRPGGKCLLHHTEHIMVPAPTEAEVFVHHVQVVYDFADCLEGLNSLKYSLATMHPKVIYGSDSCNNRFSNWT